MVSTVSEKEIASYFKRTPLSKESISEARDITTIGGVIVYSEMNTMVIMKRSKNKGSTILTTIAVHNVESFSSKWC